MVFRQEERRRGGEEMVFREEERRSGDGVQRGGEERRGEEVESNLTLLLCMTGEISDSYCRNKSLCQLSQLAEIKVIYNADGNYYLISPA